MKRLSAYLIFFLVMLSPMRAQQADSLFVYNDSSRMIKRPWRSAFQTAGLNVGVWAFDRFAMNQDYAKISLHSIGNNISNGFVWDNDKFSTNLFAHPYHGNLYFNAARSNGLTFWESVPYSFAGSLMWEMCAEVEPPAINDFLATSIGGVALGEVTHRLSSLVLDDSKRGSSRFFREFLGTLICPSRGINRLITGDAWKVRHQYYKYHDYEKLPVKFSAAIGDRYLADDNNLFKGSNSPYVEFNVVYGDPLKETTNSPYDYFSFNSTFNISGNQPLIGSVNLTAKLLGKHLEPVPGHKLLVGLFQHFDFYDSESVLKGSKKIPFKISEAAAFGLGMIYQFPSKNKRVTIKQSSFLNLVLLGGSLTDYYNVIDRNYNMGSGYSIKSNTSVDFMKYGYFELNLQHYRIFTWKGYEKKDFGNINPLYLNAQGDKGNVQLTVINPKMEINLDSKCKIGVGLYYYLRNTHYIYHLDISSQTFETRLSFRYSF
ncbi:DUF3943 domain-containing protein [uncultured Bacteroides sp.]|uniref:DUF3943 domain-containing protein n=1 Tax=uncultured Bacteroides sp. TaxID=162156 RepID=UPI002AA82910|nr:DUF3943 domain-containing protein [uncultured Bacteroides sp.]